MASTSQEFEEIEQIEVLNESNQSIQATDNATNKRKRSTAWRYFSRHESQEGISICTVCGETVKHSSNTTNLLKVCKYIL
jgi:hypothetical protein